MYRLSYGLLLLGLAAWAVAMAGCPGGAGGTLDTQYVEGVVTLDGDPVADATVTFTPVTKGQGMSATGKSDASGKYTLTVVGAGDATVEAGSGTLAGEYFVGVVKTEVPTVLTEEEAEEQGVEFQGGPEPGDDSGVTFVVPQKYNNPAKSGLKYTVQQGENNIPIELSSE